jgi:signal transduction histidine kinase
VRLRVVAALDRKELADIRSAYLGELVPSLLVLGAALVAAMALFVGYAFVPFRRLRAALAAVHAGRSRRILGTHPEEVRPLIQDLNDLIDRQNESLEKARTQAGDLAHGLKTPTVVLEALAEDAAQKGHARLAAEISEQANMIRKTVDRALKRARAGLSAAGSYRRIAAEPIAGKVISSLARTPEGLALRWINTLTKESVFPGDETDLYEIIGNLVDNAMKWARTTVAIGMRNEHGRFILTIEDDGPGMPDGVAEMLVRGKRLDEARSGSGFGLAIVKDLVEAYRGTVSFERGNLGGLLVRLEMPT